jgi:hypothetical protein
MGAFFQDRLADWPSVVIKLDFDLTVSRNVTLTLTFEGIRQEDIVQGSWIVEDFTLCVLIIRSYEVLWLQ